METMPGLCFPICSLERRSDILVHVISHYYKPFGMLFSIVEVDLYFVFLLTVFHTEYLLHLDQYHKNPPQALLHQKVHAYCRYAGHNLHVITNFACIRSWKIWSICMHTCVYNFLANNYMHTCVRNFFKNNCMNIYTYLQFSCKQSLVCNCMQFVYMCMHAVCIYHNEDYMQFDLRWCRLRKLFSKT